MIFLLQIKVILYQVENLASPLDIDPIPLENNRDEVSYDSDNVELSEPQTLTISNKIQVLKDFSEKSGLLFWCHARKYVGLRSFINMAIPW
ncbi:hypothetical protein ACH5RR_032552 [Cinchona calisaya]|uniref:Uncharacterized protein n=1 Tax=Cinchona calisaya TaxID=153742 RepID=A0ABD2YIE7_9GENT